MNRLLTTLALTATATVAQNTHEPQAPVCIYLQHNASMATGTLSRAQVFAGQMFADAGIDLKWKTGRPQSNAIIVEITAGTPAAEYPEALAYAQPFEGVHIRVFYDRIETMAGPELAPRLLAHVLVHEITHILEGLDRHSQGVMKAHWTADDVAGMARKPLSFDSSDVALIHLGVAQRNQRLRSLRAPPSVDQVRSPEPDGGGK
jgi:hypothetical protein